MPTDTTPLTDAALRRRVAIIDGTWREPPNDGRVHDADYLDRWTEFMSGSFDGMKLYESDLNAAEGAVRRWCERNNATWKLEGLSDREVVDAWIFRVDFWTATELKSHPHAAARAMCLCLVAADDAVTK